MKVKSEKASYNSAPSIGGAKVKDEKAPHNPSTKSVKVKVSTPSAGSAKVKTEAGSAKVAGEKRRSSRSNGSEVPAVRKKNVYAL